MPRWSHPKHLDRRVRSGFLWWPLRIRDESRWLERARWSETYYNYGGTGGDAWVATTWLAAREEAPNAD